MKAFIVVALFAMLAAAAFAAPHHKDGHTTDDHSEHADHEPATKDEPTAAVADKAKDETLTGAATAYLASPFAYSAYPALRAYPYAGYGAYPYGYHAYGRYPFYYR